MKYKVKETMVCGIVCHEITIYLELCNGKAIRILSESVHLSEAGAKTWYRTYVNKLNENQSYFMVA